MNSLFAALLTFVAGFTIETACVYWVHFSERNRALPTAICSMLIGTAQVLGIGESVHDWRMGVPFVLGYGIGTFFAVRRKARAAYVAMPKPKKPRRAAQDPFQRGPMVARSQTPSADTNDFGWFDIIDWCECEEFGQSVAVPCNKNCPAVIARLNREAKTRSGGKETPGSP